MQERMVGRLMVLCWLAKPPGLLGLAVKGPSKQAFERRKGREAVRASVEDEMQRAVGEFSSKLREAVTRVQSEWVNGGWQVRKRAGKWLPEIVTHAGGLSSQLSSEPLPTEVDWLTSGSEGSRALVSPAMPEGERELAVASEFGRFLSRTDVSATYKRRTDGSIVFDSESALSASVAMFTIEVTKELGAAARALARYVNDLEMELEKADAMVVKVKEDIAETARRAQEKTEAAERAITDAERLRRQQAELQSTLGTAQEAATRFEARANRVSLQVLELERSANSSKLELDDAIERAVSLEVELAKAQADVARKTDEAKMASSRADVAESLARATARERDALEGVASALQSRALAAEQTAEESRQRLEVALLETMRSEASLTEVLEDIDPSSQDAAIVERSIEYARDTVRQQVDRPRNNITMPSIWKMRKGALAAELQSYGRDPTGLKVPELRAFVRVERLKCKGLNNTQPENLVMPARGYDEKFDDPIVDDDSGNASQSSLPATS